ncbi:MAG: hypothetical protein DWQ10_13575 [Calditrichaeota bacterium]|nr:MAG: hypothetical protein DWQ10_13575 [Calditrichota bacterium]
MTFLVLSILLFWQCSNYPPPIQPNPVKIPFSQQIIKEYLTSDYNVQDLEQLYELQCFLEKELILKLDIVNKSGQVLPNHILQLRRDYKLNELKFPPRVSGKIDKIIITKSIFGKLSLKLKVVFQTYPNIALTFVPEGPGDQFIVEKSYFGHVVKVNNTEYNCAWGCENRLLVPIHLLERFH